MKATLGRGAGGELIRKAGIMAVVVESGHVAAGDLLTVELPVGPPRPLAVV